MFHFSTKLFILIAIFSCLFFSCSSEKINYNNSSEEFNQFISKCRNMPIDEFINYWNTEENKNYKFYFYKQLDPNSPISWPDESTSSEIFQSKIINCFRINVLIQSIFPGSTLVKVYQPSVTYDHYYLLLQNGDIINNTNDGKIMTLKYIPKN